MTETTKKTSSLDRVSKFFERQVSKGLKQVRVWVPVECEERIKAEAEKLRREKEVQTTDPA